MITLPITLTIAAAAALLNIWIAQRVGQVRRRARVAVGDGGNTKLLARMRAHSNYVEYTPFFLILLALIELAVGAQLWLWMVAVLYMLGRIAHAFGMDAAKPGLLRMVGTIITMLALAGLASYAIYLGYSHTGEATGWHGAATTVR